MLFGSPWQPPVLDYVNSAHQRKTSHDCETDHFLESSLRFEPVYNYIFINCHNKVKALVSTLHQTPQRWQIVCQWQMVQIDMLLSQAVDFPQ